jgi:YD repeat-containing protein
MNRAIEAAHYTGDALPYPWGSNASSTGGVTTSYGTVWDASLQKYRYTETMTDEASKTRTLTKDGLNRLTRVTEAGQADTYYTYDALDNLAGVSQSGQTRSFIYSTLGRLMVATNPENGTYNYSYDGNGNLRQKTDSQGIGVFMQYDGLNRMSYKEYNDGTAPAYSDRTAAVTYTYDTVGHPNSANCLGNGTNYAAGRLISVSSSVSGYWYSCYDALGRVLRGKQTTSGHDYPFTYNYLPGFMNSVTYPSGRTVSYTPNNRGLSTGAAVAGTTPYASSVAYTPSGAMQSMMLGNGVQETKGYNSRLQMTELNATQNGVTKLSLSYGYAPTTNNGNPSSQTISYPAQQGEALFAQTQNYLYDDRNRLGYFSEGVLNRTFDYDNWGNQTVVSTNTLSPLTPASYGNNNRIATTLGGATVQYDSRGNQTVADHQKTYFPGHSPVSHI